MRTRAITTTAVLLLTLTACGSGTEPSTTPKPSKSAAKKSTPEAKPSPDKPRAFGETLTFSDDGMTMAITVLGYEQDTFHPQTSADEEFGTKGYTWAAVDIKACLKKGTSGVTRYPWALAYADGARIEPSGVTYGDFPKPEYPYEAKMKAGDCVRGKTVFAVPAKQRPERVLYVPEALETPAEWAVPKA
ncbi:DUF4352 domain-containing protein [Streptomyces qaidamensis]|uniref:DUF4352 domain-containing protein n=1 Tax=Streptomyces qaidamensis TaxID=1783515 RepID=UPI00364F7E43